MLWFPFLHAIQICLQNSTTCEYWLGSPNTSSFTRILQDFIRNHHNECTSSIVIYSPSVNCNDNGIILSGYVLTLSEYCSATEIIQEWVMSTTSVMFQGGLFEVDANCPVVVADSQSCVPTQDVLILIQALPAAAGVATGLILTILVMILLCIKIKKSSKR